MRILTNRAAVILTLMFLMFSTAAHAGLDIDFGASVQIGDDTDLYLQISSRYFERDPDSVRRHAKLYDNPDDLTVALYLARCSGKDAERMHALRGRGLSWWEISVKLGLPTRIWFVEVDHDPGPPYGKAYGHWKKHGQSRKDVVVLTDIEARNLVAARVIHEYYGISVEAAMEARASGRNLVAIMADEYGKRHGKPAANGNAAAKQAKARPGKGRAKKR